MEMTRQLCPDCGAPLARGANVGTCPHCLLRLAVQAGSADDAAPVPVASGPADTRAVALQREQPGTRIGRYRLLEPIGEGGFGTVWMAEQQEPVRRRAALKIIKLGMDTREVIARFEAERQALALMDHPNIARVFDGGTTELGRPYFVMELVKGVRITDYCDAQRLPTEARLKLFIEVCQAVQHAHQKGVIHRDLKPNNVLVTEQDGRAVPKVIDFGIAKATGTELTDKTLFTRFNQVIGTPAYMSPEQAGLGKLDVDTRSDIYALGVLLYELLTGRPPFSDEALRHGGLDEVLRTVREKEPPKPSTRLSTLSQEDLQAAAVRRAVPAARLSKLVRGELDWIVMKCLEKDRARRYETANGLARDLERFLNDEPVVARPATAIHRFRKAVRRNRVAFSAAAAVTMALIVGMVLSIWQAARATAAESAQARLRRAAEAESFKSRQVLGFLRSMLAGIRPQVSLGHDTRLLREIADQTAAQVAAQLRDQPAIETELCGLLGTVYRDLIEFDKAEAMHRQGVTVARQIAAEQPAALVQALLMLGDTLAMQGKLAEAEPVFREGLDLNWKLPDPTAHPSLYNGLGELLRKEGRVAEAEALNLEALDVWRRSTNWDGLVRALVTRSEVCRSQGRWADAEAASREGYAICQQHLSSDPGMLAWLSGDLARALEPQGKLAEAEFYYRTSFTNTVRDEPLNLKRFFPYQGLARVLRKQGRAAEAEAILTEHLAAYRERVGRGAVSYVSFELILNLTEALDEQGKTNETHALLTEILGSAPQALATMSAEDQIEVLAILAELLVDHHRFAEAEPRARDGLALWRAHRPARWHVRARLARALGVSLRQQGQWAEAEPAYREAIAESVRAWPDQPARWEPLLTDLALVLGQLGKPVSLEALRRELLPAEFRPATPSPTRAN